VEFEVRGVLLLVSLAFLGLYAGLHTVGLVPGLVMSEVIHDHQTLAD
jgi:hypothetical protein